MGGVSKDNINKGGKWAGKKKQMGWRARWRKTNGLESKDKKIKGGGRARIRNESRRESKDKKESREGSDKKRKEEGEQG